VHLLQPHVREAEIVLGRPDECEFGGRLTQTHDGAVLFKKLKAARVCGLGPGGARPALFPAVLSEDFTRWLSVLPVADVLALDGPGRERESAKHYREQ
jgi:hypothetical protein